MTKAILNKKRNCSIDIFRLVCAVMVVAIHTKPLFDVNYAAGFLVSETFTRMAVPFFFCVSGFYYIKGMMSGKNGIRKDLNTLRSLIVVYCIWSVLYYILYLKQKMVYEIPTDIFITNIIRGFFLVGSYYHLWFFPALIFCILLAMFFNRIGMLKFLAYGSILLYIPGLLGCSYYGLGNEIPIFRDFINYEWFTEIRQAIFTGIPFFMLGYFLNVFKGKYDKITNRKLFAALAIAAMLFLAEIFFVVRAELQSNVIITVLLYPLLAIVMMILLNNPLPEKVEAARYARGIANFTYFSHPMFIAFMEREELLNIQMENTPTFLVIASLTILLGLLLVKLDNKWLNKAFM